MENSKNREVLIYLIFFLSAYAHAQNTSHIREFDLETINKLGHEIYRIDQYASIATDILFNQGLNLKNYPIRGWIVMEYSDGVSITFVGEYKSGLRGVFEIRPNAEPKDRFKIVEGRKLTTVEESKFKARQTASKGINEYCSNRYNTVVIADPTSDSWLVYLLAATDDPNLILAGGHYRFTISKDGTTILNTDKLSNSCLTLNKKAEDIPNGATPVMMFMSHLVSKTPIETHVYLTLLHHMDFAVATNDGKVWKISKNGIEILK